MNNAIFAEIKTIIMNKFHGTEQWDKVWDFMYELEKMVASKDQIMSVPEKGRLLLDMLKYSWKSHGSGNDGRFEPMAQAFLQTVLGISTAWARIIPTGVFEAYFWSKKDAEKVKTELGWTAEIKEVDTSDYRLLMTL